MNADPLYSTLGRTGLSVHRLGLSGLYRPGKRAIHTALDAGLNFILVSPFDTQTHRVLRDLLPAHRDELVLFTGGWNLIGHWPNMRRGLEKRLRKLKTDYVDVYVYGGARDRASFHERVLPDLMRFKEEGKARFIGISSHDRAFAGRMASAGDLDVLMVRYNAAHRGAEEDVFPHLGQHNPGLISYTATCWRYLLRPPRDWPKTAPVPTAGDCYRFVLSNPNVHVCLTAPTNLKQMEENLASLAAGPMDAEEMQFMREFGDRIYRRRKFYR
jgi:aryl-alcohol dehydrogenase-like predicted oxidoreductase